MILKFITVWAGLLLHFKLLKPSGIESGKICKLEGSIHPCLSILTSAIYVSKYARAMPWLTCWFCPCFHLACLQLCSIMKPLTVGI